MLGQISTKTETKEEPKKIWNFQTKKDPNTMDIDSMTAEQQTEAMKKGLCFRCGKQGHLNKDCHEKKRKKKEEEKKKWTSKELQAHVRALFETMDEKEKKAFKEDFA